MLLCDPFVLGVLGVLGVLWCEPASLALMGLGLAGLAVACHRKQAA